MQFYKNYLQLDRMVQHQVSSIEMQTKEICSVSIW